MNIDKWMKEKYGAKQVGKLMMKPGTFTGYAEYKSKHQTFIVHDDGDFGYTVYSFAESIKEGGK